MKIPSNEYEFRVYEGKLAMFKKWANQADDWEMYWSKHSPEDIINYYSHGNLGEFEVINHYLPKNAPVLEAGCGAGGIVMALQSKGYQVEGIDFAENIIQKMKTFLPNLNIFKGDIYNVNVRDNYYGGYISLGVLEHNPNGPMEGLLEAHRILKRDGIAFISVPYLNPTRKKWLVNLKNSDQSTQEDHIKFYQFYFASDEFKNYLQNAKFSCVYVFPYAVFAGITRDHRIGRWLKKKNFFSKRIEKWVVNWCESAPSWARNRWGHMALFICKPM